MKGLFIGFLEENNALENFKYALEIGEQPMLDIYLTRVEDYDYLYAVTPWCDTEQDHEYWSNLNKKWQIILSQNEKNN